MGFKWTKGWIWATFACSVNVAYVTGISRLILSCLNTHLLLCGINSLRDEVFAAPGVFFKHSTEGS